MIGYLLRKSVIVIVVIGVIVSVFVPDMISRKIHKRRYK